MCMYYADDFVESVQTTVDVPLHKSTTFSDLSLRAISKHPVALPVRTPPPVYVTDVPAAVDFDMFAAGRAQVLALRLGATDDSYRLLCDETLHRPNALRILSAVVVPSTMRQAFTAIVVLFEGPLDWSGTDMFVVFLFF